MPLPPSVDTFILVGRYPGLDGQSATGSVTFTPNVTPLTDTADPAMIVGPATVRLVDGRFSARLPYTDNSSLSPSGWAIEVAESIDGISNRAPFLIQVVRPQGPTVDLATVAPVSPPPAAVSTVYGVLAQPNTWSGLNNFTGGLAIGGVRISTPPASSAQFLSGDGSWRLPPSGAVLSVNGLLGDVVLTPSIIGALPTSAFTARGSLLVGSGASAYVVLPSGSDGYVLTSSAAAPGGVVWAPSSGGGGGTTVRVRFGYVTSGDQTLNADASWSAYPLVTLSVPASVGDVVSLFVKAMWQKGSGDQIDWATHTTAGGLVHFASNGTGTPAVQGDPGWYPDGAFPRNGSPWTFRVQAADIETDGSVHVVLAHLGGSGGTFFSSTNYPAELTMVNWGPQT